MAWEYFLKYFFLSSLSVWSSHPSLSHLPADEGWAGKSVLDFNQKFPFWGRRLTRAGGLLPGFFSGPWHGSAEGRASDHWQPSQAALAFLTKILLLWKLSSEMFLTKYSVHWCLLRILMGKCWKGKMRKIWPRMVKSHKKTDFRCFWQNAASWIFVLNKSRFSNFLKAELCIHIFANKSSVSICISVFIS